MIYNWTSPLNTINAHKQISDNEATNVQTRVDMIRHVGNISNRFAAYII